MNIFKKLAVIVVTAYAKRIYEQAEKKAEEKREKTKQMVFVISDQFHSGNRMLVLTYDEYKAIRDKVVHADKLSFSYGRLRNTCWYHTADPFGHFGLGTRDREIRLRAFIKDSLMKANLVRE